LFYVDDRQATAAEIEESDEELWRIGYWLAPGPQNDFGHQGEWKSYGVSTHGAG
jgi:hypothetical protein